MPEISVLMPVRNGEEYIREAIDSVLKQTFTDFEFIIMDDGSEDKTVEIIKSYSDSRIRLEKRKPNFIKNLNEGLALAQGDYIARMDADDIMHSDRLRIQLKRMKQNPDIVLCSSWAKRFQTDKEDMQLLQFGENYIDQPMLGFLKYNFLSHPTVMLKKAFLEMHDLSYEDYLCVEDYKLWFEITKCGGKIFIEPQYLMFLRNSPKQVTILKQEEMLKQTIVVQKEILEYLLQNTPQNEVLYRLLVDWEELVKDKLVTWNLAFRLFYDILCKKMNKLSSLEK